MAHTKGPWSVTDCGQVVRAGKIAVATVQSQLGHAQDTYNWQEMRHNARLIASAPALLAALEELIEYAAICAADNDERPASLTAARAAIAAARKGE